MELLSQLGPAIIVIGFIFAGVIFYRPYAGILSMTLMIPLEPVMILSGGFTAIKAVGIITFIAFVLHYLLGREKIRIEWKISLPLILFIVWTTLTLEGSFKSIIKFGQLLVFTMITISLCHQNDKRIVFIICAIIVGCFISTYLAASGYLSDTNLTARAAIQEQNANKFALTNGVGILLLFFLLSTCKKIFLKSRFNIFISLILYAGSVLLAYGLVISASRGAVVAICMSIFIYLAAQKSRFKSSVNIILILLMVSAVIFVGLRKGFINEYSLNRLKSIESPGKTTLAGRFTIWKIGIKIAEENPITGVGFGKFESAYAKYSGFSISNVITKGIPWDPHSTYLSILAETGVIGFGFFMWFLSYLTFYVVKRKNQNKVFSLCVLILIGIISLKSTIHTIKVYWISLALCYLISNYGSQPFYSGGHSEVEAKER
jgi:O-antigen ligase